MTAKNTTLTLEHIEDAELVAWMREQLARIKDFLIDHEADEEMISPIDRAIEDNENWSDPENYDLLNNTSSGSC
ncbi:hypothetical protein [Shinella fusca]|uniref:Uncharacterized protein n=1 Tax=Shinella fusca TaxID=544480 RepID=A0A7W8DWS0_9HYPH|nr:hypothetical protein [Shinella fusca]MBB5045002.1 hypothetical protein [Shinella fusca]